MCSLISKLILLFPSQSRNGTEIELFQTFSFLFSLQHNPIPEELDPNTFEEIWTRISEMSPSVATNPFSGTKRLCLGENSIV